MAIVDIQPAILLFLPGRLKSIIKASRGSNTAASVKWMVKESIECKNSSNFILSFFHCRDAILCVSLLLIKVYQRRKVLRLYVSILQIINLSRINRFILPVHI